MAQNIPGRRPAPPTTAVVQVGDDGAATLYLGTEPVEHASGGDSATVMRVLVDYAATIGAGVRVTTQMPDGTWTRHRLDPDGTLTPLPRNESDARTAANSAGSPGAPRSRGGTVWSRIANSVASRSWLLVMLVMLAAVLVAVLTTT